MNKILLNFLVVGVSIAGIQGAYAMRLKENEDVNKTTLIKPIFKTPAPLEKKKIQIEIYKGKVRTFNTKITGVKVCISPGGLLEVGFSEIQDASAVKVGNHSLEERNVNTSSMVQRGMIHSSPSKNKTPMQHGMIPRTPSKHNGMTRWRKADMSSFSSNRKYNKTIKPPVKKENIVRNDAPIIPVAPPYH